MNRLLEQLKILLARKPPPVKAAAEARQAVQAVCDEAAEAFPGWEGRVSLGKLAAWQRLKEGSDSLQTDAACVAACLTAGQPGGFGRAREAATAMAVQLLRKDLPYSDEQLSSLLTHAASQRHLTYGMPVKSILGAVERRCGGAMAQGALRAGLKTLLARIRATDSSYGATQHTRQLRSRIEQLLSADHGADEQAMPRGPWGESVQRWLTEQPANEQTAWQALLRFAASSGDKSRPSKRWLAEMDAKLEAIGRPAARRRLSDWLADCQLDPSRPDPSLDVLKGLIWSASLLDGEDMASPIGRFAETCFRKIPNVGARSVKLGNACLWALAAMSPAEPGIAQLVRLRTKIKYPSARDQIAKNLAAAAAAAGQSLEDLEEIALPDFDLDVEGRHELRLGEATAVTTVTSEGAVLSWIGANGKVRKTAPASVSKDHKAEVSALKQRTKDIKAAQAAQIIRIEESWLEGRCWPFAIWRQRYLEHPLRRPIAEALIWELEHDGHPFAVLPQDRVLRSLSGEDCEATDDDKVRLWHPLDSDPDDVLAWRKVILEKEITQPIKQAHREVYVLTDAERSTEIYSNRFAAHILRQHQFRALCQARGWRYDLQGAWDSWNVPTRQVPQHHLAVEYHVEQADQGQFSEAAVALHLSSDQVRFVSGDGAALRLEDVPPMVFSELMRDVDLFVAVTSVANDPDWADGGPEGHHGTYWRETALGDLGETAKTRRALLSALAPKLSIADRLIVTEKYLEVRGRLHDYKIHLGSSNILIQPDNRYLCIVRGGPSQGQQRRHPPAVLRRYPALHHSQQGLLARGGRQDHRSHDPFAAAPLTTRRVLGQGQPMACRQTDDRLPPQRNCTA